MGLFSRKRRPPKDTSSVEFKRYMAERISDKLIKCVLERHDDYTDTIIGKSGFFALAASGERRFFAVMGDVNKQKRRIIFEQKKESGA